MQDSEIAYDRFQNGRDALDAGDLELALSLFRDALEHAVHFKTLELIGDTLCMLNRHGEAIIPLAAATGLNRGSRPPCLLAEAFAAIGQWSEAKEAAEESLRRTPGYRRALAVLADAERQLTTGCS